MKRRELEDSIGARVEIDLRIANGRLRFAREDRLLRVDPHGRFHEVDIPGEGIFHVTSREIVHVRERGIRR